MATPTKATIADLYALPDNVKAELVDGEIVFMSPTGDLPGSAGGIIYASLLSYARRTKTGRAYADNTGFLVDLPHRSSFSPDAAFYTGKRTGMRFLEGAPIFAVEVRSENDYGPAAERAIEEKRADYFAAGTLVVWDVDLLSAEVVKVYRATDPTTPTVYRRGELAEAEPAVPGWHLAVDELYE
jgi:Uma2 family endonuclease